jgi:Bacterial type II and III secretion system protein
MRRALWIGLLNSALSIPSLAVAREPSEQDMPPRPPTFWAPYQQHLAGPGVAFPGQPTPPIALEAALPPPPVPGGPAIIDIGQPPIVYSPASDFGKRVECENSWTQQCGGPTGFQWQVATAPMPVMIAPPFPFAGAPQPGNWLPHPLAAVAPPPGSSFPQPFPAVAPCCGGCAADQQSEHHPQPPCAGYFECPCMPGVAVAAAGNGFPPCPCPNCAMPLPPCAGPVCVLPPPPAESATRYFAACEPASKANVADRLEHILQAVQHLEAAGLQTEAHHVRQQSDELVRELIRQTRESKHQTTDSAALTSSNKQVAVHVKLMELNLTKMRQLGIDFKSIPCGAVETNSRCKGFEQLVDSLRRHGIVTMLAEPDVVTLSGREAHFHCGGEIPYPAASGSDTAGIQYRSYGTELDVLPVVTDSNRIRLHVRPRLTELDPALSVALQGREIPGLHSREFETAIELGSGQTFVLNGMVEQKECTRLTVDEDESSSTTTEQRPITVMEDVALLVTIRSEIIEQENCVITKADCSCLPTAALDSCGSTDQLRCCGDPVSCDVTQCGCAIQSSCAADPSLTSALICGEQLSAADEATSRSIWQQSWFDVGKPALNFHDTQDSPQSLFKTSADFGFGGSNSRRQALPVVVPAPDRGAYWK